MAIEYLGSEYLGANRGMSTVNRDVTNARGQVIGQFQDQVQVLRESHEYVYRCKYCGQEYSDVGTFENQNY